MSIHIFIPPPQEQPPLPMSTPQFFPLTSVAPVLPHLMPQHQPLYHLFPPAPISVPMQFTAPTSAVAYYQGAPLFYQTPSSVPLPHLHTMIPFNQSLSHQNESFFGGYSRPAEYPPPAYEDAILTSSTLVEPIHPAAFVSSGSESMDATESTAGAGTLQSEVNPDENISSSQNNDTSEEKTALDSFPEEQSFTPASSSSSGISLDGSELNSDRSSVGSSLTSSPLCSTSSSELSSSSEESPRPTSSDGSSVSSYGPGQFHGYISGTETSSDESRSLVAYGSVSNSSFSSNDTFVDQFGFTDYGVPTMMQDLVAVIPTGPVQVQPSAELMVYPGEATILVYSRNDGSGSVITYNEREIPYVANIFDFRVQESFKEQSGPMLNYSYYVPPRTADDDYFGGQLATWQLKLVQYFIKFQPHKWKMHGVPETFNLELFLGLAMDVIGEFHIVSKLRFCCRSCKTPWTSKKGTIVFKFCFNSAFQQGWILMRIFGQMCMKQECSDWSFQNPACYPEEIDRAMKKLSEYVGNKCYGLAVKPNSFAECFKSIRKSGIGGNDAKESGKSGFSPPHKREYCQACMNGVCKNLYTLSHLATPALLSS